MNRYIMNLIVACICNIAAWGIPASREPIIHILDNGEVDTIFLYGDEYSSYRVNKHNQRLLNSRLFLEENPQINHNRTTIHAPQRLLLQSYMPSRGKVHVPVLLVDFTDYSFSIEDPITQFDDLFNGKGGSNPHATGSVHDYFIASSDSVLDLQYDVFGVYTLSHKMEYYGANQTNNYGVTTNHNIRAKELVEEAVEQATQNGVDFSKYDNNNDGYIDNVSIVVAGYNEAEGGVEQTIWPHYNTINNGKKYGNKYISGYLIISEYRSNRGNTQAGIGTYCHEFGHALGLPDLYDTNKSNNYTIGYWDIMCSGSYNNNGSTPPTYTAFERFMMGWLTPKQITTSGLKTIRPLETSNEAYLISNNTHNLDANFPTPSEYFLLENRQALGWDAGKEALIGTGLLISHITFDQNGWNHNSFNNQLPLGYAIVSAAIEEPTKSTTADIFPGSANKTTWLPTFNNSTTIDKYKVSNILQRSNGDISFFIGDISNKSLLIKPQELDTFITTFNTFIEEYFEQTIDINGKNLPAGEIHINTIGRFCVSTDGINWGKTEEQIIDTIKKDGNYNKKIHIRFKPTRQSCDPLGGQLIVITADSSVYATHSFIGKAPRPVYITQPDSLLLSTKTSSYIKVKWNEVNDAEYYYATIYQQDVNKTDTTYTEIAKHKVIAPINSILFDNLISGQKYKITLAAAEYKSCYEHVSSSTELYTSTLTEKNKNSIFPMLLEDGRYVLWIEEPFQEEGTMLVFRANGAFLFKKQISIGTPYSEIPIEKMQHGELYIIKITTSKLKRANLWTKFIYY